MTINLPQTYLIGLCLLLFIIAILVGKQLYKVRQTRKIQRKLRTIDSSLIFSLVGYTNSGKSSIFNNLTTSNVLVKDMVFATLDTKMGLVDLSNKKKIILSDTVGFISALPTELIDSFNASLEELFSSDFLLLVHDLSNSEVEQQSELVFNTLIQIGFTYEQLQKKIINVFNKSDLNSNIDNIQVKFKNNSVLTSAINNYGLKDLRILMESLVDESLSNVIFLVPQYSSKITSWIYKNSYVIDEKYSNTGFDGNKIKAKISQERLNSFKYNFPEILVNIK